MFQITKTIKDLWEKIKEVFSTLYTKVRSWLSIVYNKLNLNDKFLHNLHMAKSCKKKRTRKKYAKLVFKRN